MRGRGSKLLAVGRGQRDRLSFPVRGRGSKHRRRVAAGAAARRPPCGGVSRSTFYDASGVPLGDGELVTRIDAICGEFECYGYRRVGAALRHQGVVVNGKKLRRLMREHELQPKRRRRYVVTLTAIMPDRSIPTWPTTLFPSVRISFGSPTSPTSPFRAASSVRIAVAALKVAIRNRTPPRGCTIIPIEDRNMHLRCIGSCWLLTA